MRRFVLVDGLLFALIVLGSIVGGFVYKTIWPRAEKPKQIQVASGILTGTPTPAPGEFVIATGGSGPYIWEIVNSDGVQISKNCDASLQSHVYHLARLKVLSPCVEVTGTIQKIKHEPDGDDHIQLKLDPQYESMLNDRNRSAQHGALVVEPICQRPPTQMDAVAACAGFKSKIVVPKVGTRVKVTGPYVLDTEAGHGWREIHPVTSIERQKVLEF